MPEDQVPATGVIGLGAIGRGVAGALQRAGVDLTVYDLRAEATAPFADGARLAASAAELAGHVEVSVIAVVDDDQVRAVVAGPDGLLARARPGHTIVVVSTVATDTIVAVAAEASAKGVALVDCGVSGGPGAAADGALVCMLGGDPATVERVRPVLEILGDEVLHMGPLGAGLSAKLARNVVQYGSWLAAYEGQVLAEAAGIDLPTLARAIKASDRRIGGASTLMFRRTVRPLRADEATDAALIEPMTAAASLAHKDLRSALRLAEALDVGLPMARLTEHYCDAIFGVGDAARRPGDGEAVTTFTGEERLLVDGVLRPSSDGTTFETVNPATEEVLGVVADGTAEDMDAAIGAARRAFDETSWSTDLKHRVACLRQLQAALTSHAEEIRSLTVAEVGSPLSLTYTAQLDDPVSSLGWVAQLAEGYEWETDLGDAAPFGIPSHRWVRREATGVVGAITPWNVPHQINLAKLGPALAAGNTVVLKPAPDTPWCATVLGRLIAEETDIPPGVVNIVPASDHRIGAVLATDPRVDQLSFTGSTATGRMVMAAAAETLKKVFLELGGKSAFVVLDDADLRGACATAAFTVCTHAGQGCAITTRLLVPRRLLDEATEATATVLSKLPAADPTDPATICGPLISARQRDRVEGYLTLAGEEGGTVVVGGGRPGNLERGYFVEPTLIAGLPNHARVAREEIFGPVLVVIPHDGDDDAVALANDSPYGLSGSVWSADRDRAVGVANRIRTGTIGVNGGLWYSPDVPFGGYKQSGIGREMGVAGFEEYLQTKSLAEPA